MTDMIREANKTYVFFEPLGTTITAKWRCELSTDNGMLATGHGTTQASAKKSADDTLARLIKIEYPTRFQKTFIPPDRPTYWNTQDRIDELCRLWLVSTTHDLSIMWAALDMDSCTSSAYLGCETCGPDTETDFDIEFFREGHLMKEIYNVDGDPLTFLAERLFKLEDELKSQGNLPW